MRIRPARFLLAMSLLLAGCGSDQPAGPAAIRFTEVDLPGGAKPVVLTPVGDTLLIGVRRDGEPVVPGLLRRDAAGRLTEIAVEPAELYGEQAFWYSIAADGERILALGGKTGGAHGNVRWSVWTGSAAGLTQQPQPITTFGGYGAGDVIDAVLTPAGPAFVGTWQNATVGLDIMVWRPDGRYWARQPVAGTALENRQDSLKFPRSAVHAGAGTMIAGWELSSGRQRPAVWRAASGLTGWTMARLPDAGRSAVAVAARCADSTCAVAGWVDGRLAMWQLRGDRWTRVPDVPRVAVAPDADLAAPVEVGGHPTVVVHDGSRVVLAGAGGSRAADGPTGTVGAVARVGGALFVAAGGKLWQADVAA